MNIISFYHPKPLIPLPTRIQVQMRVVLIPIRILRLSKVNEKLSRSPDKRFRQDFTENPSSLHEGVKTSNRFDYLLQRKGELLPYMRWCWGVGRGMGPGGWLRWFAYHFVLLRAGHPQYPALLLTPVLLPSSSEMAVGSLVFIFLVQNSLEPHSYL